jgi:hypothetical protein
MIDWRLGTNYALRVVLAIFRIVVFSTCKKISIDHTQLCMSSIHHLNDVLRAAKASPPSRQSSIAGHVRVKKTKEGDVMPDLSDLDWSDARTQ